MTADTVDLEDCDMMFKGYVGSFCTEEIMDVNSFLNPPFRKLPPVPPIFQNKYSNSMYDFPEYSYVMPLESTFDLHNIPKFSEWNDVLPFDNILTPEEDEQIYQTISDSLSSYMIPPPPTLEYSSHSDMESDFFQIVSPNSVLPTPQIKEENVVQLESMWSEISGLSDEKLVKMVDDGCLEDNSITIDDIFMKKKRRKLTHLDIDHCYYQRLPADDDYEEENEDDFFNSSPCSPASSCSDQIVAARGVKRSRPKRKNVRRKKIKQEVISSEDEEVDVETPCSVPLVVPKITISISQTVNPPPPRRGRKPKNQGQNVKKPNNKNYPVSPKVLQAAIQQQKKKCYITKSGRVTKISNSVETTPSTSAPSSISNSRSNSDNEDNIDKRASHNMAERNRRQELTNLFQGLRRRVKEIRHNPKASKVAILQGATNRVQTLEGRIRCQELELSQLKADVQKKITLLQMALKNSRGYSS